LEISIESKGRVQPLFFFKCPVSFKEYDKANTSNCLDNLGAFSLSCWKHIGKIHFFFPRDAAGHIYDSKQADLHHYQEVFAKFALALEAYDDGMPVYFYIRGDDYANHFLMVCNWIQIHCIACQPKKKQGKGHMEKKRQARFEDTGYCSSIN
jgi:hypothetical protein